MECTSRIAPPLRPQGRRGRASRAATCGQGREPVLEPSGKAARMPALAVLWHPTLRHAARARPGRPRSTWRHASGNTPPVRRSAATTRPSSSSTGRSARAPTRRCPRCATCATATRRARRSTSSPHRPPRRAPGLLVYFHGGYWQELSKDDSAFLAPAWHAAGFAHAVVGYTLAPEARLPEIVDAVPRGARVARRPRRHARVRCGRRGHRRQLRRRLPGRGTAPIARRCPCEASCPCPACSTWRRSSARRSTTPSAWMRRRPRRWTCWRPSARTARPSSRGAKWRRSEFKRQSRAFAARLDQRRHALHGARSAGTEPLRRDPRARRSGLAALCRRAPAVRR